MGLSGQPPWVPEDGGSLESPLYYIYILRNPTNLVEASMKFMWESFDDVLQAELQGDNRFTSFAGP